MPKGRASPLTTLNGLAMDEFNWPITLKKLNHVKLFKITISLTYINEKARTCPKQYEIK
jgi:hypothetical protein